MPGREHSLAGGEKLFPLGTGSSRGELLAEDLHPQGGRSDQEANNGCRRERGGNEHQRFVHCSKRGVFLTSALSKER